MALENPSTIDVIAKDRSGRPVLAIIDTGVTVDEETRVALLVQKLRYYATFLAGNSFSNLCLDIMPGDVRIMVLSKDPPSLAMRQIKTAEPDEHCGLSVPILFRQLCASAKGWD